MTYTVSGIPNCRSKSCWGNYAVYTAKHLKMYVRQTRPRKEITVISEQQRKWWKKVQRLWFPLFAPCTPANLVVLCVACSFSCMLVHCDLFPFFGINLSSCDRACLCVLLRCLSLFCMLLNKPFFAQHALLQVVFCTIFRRTSNPGQELWAHKLQKLCILVRKWHSFQREQPATWNSAKFSGIYPSASVHLKAKF